jgi:hypothetical protein
VKRISERKEEITTDFTDFQDFWEFFGNFLFFLSTFLALGSAE